MDQGHEREIDTENVPVLLDVMCGGLTSILRMVGYDTAYALDREIESDASIRAVGENENRLLVTRDEDLADRYDPAVLLESTDTDEQLRELKRAGFDLSLSEPRRCSSCNGELRRRDSEDLEETTPEWVPDPGETPLWRCGDCGQYFWKGSHWDDVGARLEAIEE
ncbi:MAG: Mut7-C RNAse domain-containing protein [Halodesulfurarchaeum sp.]